MLVLIIKAGKKILDRGIVLENSVFFSSDLLSTVKCSDVNVEDEGLENCYLLTQESSEDCVVHVSQFCCCLNDLVEERKKNNWFNICMNAYLLSSFLHEVKKSEIFRRNVVRNFLSHHVRKCKSPVKCPKDNSQHLQVVIQVKWPENLLIDFACNDRMLRLVNEKLELENLMAWLSTLGGAYSALGDEFLHCAEVAGKISMEQLRIALKLADPITVAKCKVYFAISLLQRGYLREPILLVREQYKYSQSLLEVVRDSRLVNMCKGVWAKIQYLYSLKKKNRHLAAINSSISNYSFDSQCTTDSNK